MSPDWCPSKSGSGEGVETKGPTLTLALSLKRERGFADRTREMIPTLPLEERHSGFHEVDQCLDDEQALREANRCLQCDLELRLGRGGRE